MGHVIKPDYKRGAHAPLSPSAAKRWMRCPGSVKRCKEAKQTTSIPAEEGSAAHALGEICLIEKTNPADYLGQSILSPEGIQFEITQEWVDALNDYVGAVRDAVARGGKLFVEQSFTLYPDLCWGTADAVVKFKESISVFDLKFGQAMEVDAEWNEQEMIYALGAIKRLFPYCPPALPVDLYIVQPRHWKNVKEPIRHFALTYDDLLSWEDFQLLDAVYQIENNPDLCVAGEIQCHWCNGAEGCKALKKASLTICETNAPTIEMPYFPADVQQFSPEQLALAYEIEFAYKKWKKTMDEKFKQVKGRIIDMHKSGLTVPGYKAVRGRATKVWRDEDATAKAVKGYGVDPYPEKLITPAAFLSELAKVEPEMVDRATKRLIKFEYGEDIAPADSKKAALPLHGAEDVFSEIETAE